MLIGFANDVETMFAVTSLDGIPFPNLFKLLSLSFPSQHILCLFLTLVYCAAHKDFFRKCDHIRSFLRIWSHLLKKFILENFIFCVVLRKLLLRFSGCLEYLCWWLWRRPIVLVNNFVCDAICCYYLCKKPGEKNSFQFVILHSATFIEKWMWFNLQWTLQIRISRSPISKKYRLWDGNMCWIASKYLARQLPSLHDNKYTVHYHYITF